MRRPAWSKLLWPALLLGVAGPLAALAGEHRASRPAVPGAVDILQGRPVPGALNRSEEGFLPPEVAFDLTSASVEGAAIRLRWTLADSYYLYHDRFRFTARAPVDLVLGEARLPPGMVKDDAHFGRVRVHYHEVEARVPILSRGREAPSLVLEVGYQGCTDKGLCYPPMTRTLTLAVPP